MTERTRAAGEPGDHRQNGARSTSLEPGPSSSPPRAPAGARAARLSAPSPFVDVPALAAALRRRWLVVAAATLIGISGGIALSLASPPAFSADTVLLLRHPGQADQARAIATDALLAKTRAVAQQAIVEGGLAVSVQDLVASYRTVALSQDLLQIRGTGPNGKEAVRRTAALADTYLSFRAAELRRQSDIAIAAIEVRQQSLRSELDSVIERIGSLSDAPTDDESVRLLGELLSRRQTLNSQINGLSQQIDALNADANAVAARSRVVDPAGEQARSPLRATVLNTVTGGLLGLMLGAGGIILQAVTSDRLRRRGDIMTQLGARVALSLGPLAGSPRSQRRRLAHHLSSPSGDVSSLVRHLCRVLTSRESAKPSLVVLSVDSDGPAALAVAALTTELVRQHERVLLVDLSASSALATIFDVAPEPRRTVALPGGAGSVELVLPLSAPGVRPGEDDVDVERLRLQDSASAVVVLATLNPATGADHLAVWAWNAVAVVTAGRSTATTLRSTAEMVAAAGIALDSAVLIGSDVDDQTIGFPVERPGGTRRLDPAWSGT